MPPPGKDLVHGHRRPLHRVLALGQVDLFRQAYRLGNGAAAVATLAARHHVVAHRGLGGALHVLAVLVAGGTGAPLAHVVLLLAPRGLLVLHELSPGSRWTLTLFAGERTIAPLLISRRRV